MVDGWQRGFCAECGQGLFVKTPRRIHSCRMRALVTGATGFVGNHVVRALVRRGVEVRVLIRSTSDRSVLADLPVTAVAGDLMEPSTLKEACQGMNLVVHVAADYRLWVPDPKRMYDVNVTGTNNVIGAAVRAGVDRIVYTSSAVTAATREDRAATEADFIETEACRSTYQQTKVQAERAAWEWIRRGARITIVNPSTVIGPVDRQPSPTGRLIRDFVSGRLPAYLNAMLNWIDVRDVAEGHWLAATRGRIGERYLLAHENLTVGQFLALLAQTCGRPIPRWRIPYAVAYAVGSMSELWAGWLGGEPRATRDGVRMTTVAMRYNGMKAVNDLGLPQTPLRITIADAVRWLIERGYIQHGGSL